MITPCKKKTPFFEVERKLHFRLFFIGKGVLRKKVGNRFPILRFIDHE